MAEEPNHEPFVPWLYRLDPSIAHLKAERLERRGPGQFIVVGKTRDGYAAETRFTGGASLERITARITPPPGS